LQWESGWAGRQYARMVITDTLLTRAHPTDTTGLAGSQADCSLAPGRGTAGAVDGAAVGDVADGATDAPAMVTGEGAMATAAAVMGTAAVATADMQDTATRDAGMLDAATQVASTGVADSTAAPAEASTVEGVVDSTAVAADMAGVDTGKSLER
jgi:hypothetical protein